MADSFRRSAAQGSDRPRRHLFQAVSGQPFFHREIKCLFFL